MIDGPITHADGHDGPGSISELVPSLAAVVDDVIVGREAAAPVEFEGQPLCLKSVHERARALLGELDLSKINSFPHFDVVRPAIYFWTMMAISRRDPTIQQSGGRRADYLRTLLARGERTSAERGKAHRRRPPDTPSAHLSRHPIMGNRRSDRGLPIRFPSLLWVQAFATC